MDTLRSRLVLWLKAARFPFCGASVLPVLVGSTLPFWLRPPGFVFSPWRCVEALAAVLLIHVGANLANDYYDHANQTDVRNPNRGDLSGGSGLIGDVLPAGQFLRLSVVCLAAGAALGLHLNAALPGNLLLVLGAVGILLGFFYTAPPLRLSYRGLGEMAVGLCFGVLPVVGAYYVQTGLVSWRVVLASLPLTLAVVLLLWVNEIADAEGDALAGKKTLVVILGARRAARSFVPVLCVLIFAALFLAVFTASLIPLTLVAVLAFGLVRTVVAVSWKRHDRPKQFAEAQVNAVKLHLTLGLIIAASALAAIGS